MMGMIAGSTVLKVIIHHSITGGSKKIQFHESNSKTNIGEYHRAL